MFMNFAIFLFVYLFVSIILPLTMAFKWKGLISIITLLIAGRLAILRFLFPGYGGIEANKFLLVITAFFQGIIIIIFLIAFLRDIIWALSFVLTLLHKAEAGQHFRAFIRSIPFTLGLLVFCAILSGYMLYQAAKVPDINKQELHLNNWPSQLDGLKIAIISDLHISRFFNRPWTNRVVDKVNSLEPELILIPGDLVDGDVVIRAPQVEPLSRLKSKYGNYMCVGNHEYISIISDWLPAFRELNLINLYNSHKTLKIRDTELVLAGVTDPSAYRRNLPGPDLQKALKGVSFDGPPVILLDHRPGNAWENSKDPRVTLQLSGHTHGGLFPVLSIMVRKANKGFLRDWYSVGNLMMYVHPGTGLWSGVPMRLFNPSEITLLTIFKKK